MYIDSKICIHTTRIENKGQLSCIEAKENEKEISHCCTITQCKRQASISSNFDQIQSAKLH